MTVKLRVRPRHFAGGFRVVVSAGFLEPIFLIFFADF